MQVNLLYVYTYKKYLHPMHCKKNFDRLYDKKFYQVDKPGGGEVRSL